MITHSPLSKVVIVAVTDVSHMLVLQIFIEFLAGSRYYPRPWGNSDE